jgi:hypothetical protein
MATFIRPLFEPARTVRLTPSKARFSPPDATWILFLALPLPQQAAAETLHYGRAAGFHTAFTSDTSGFPPSIILDILTHPELDVQCEEQVLLCRELSTFLACAVSCWHWQHCVDLSQCLSERCCPAGSFSIESNSFPMGRQCLEYLKWLQAGSSSLCRQPGAVACTLCISNRNIFGVCLQACGAGQGTQYSLLPCERETAALIHFGGAAGAGFCATLPAHHTACSRSVL